MKADSEEISKNNSSEEWKEWADFYRATFAKSEMREELKGEIGNYEKEQIAKFVSIKIENLIRRGYRATHKGREIVDAVQEKKSKLLSETILEVSERLTREVLSQLRQQEDERFLSFEDFIYILESTSDKRGQTIKSVKFLNNKGFSATTKEKNLSEAMYETDYREGAKSGIDIVAQCFFKETTKSINSIREDIIIPSAEKIIKIKI